VLPRESELVSWPQRREVSWKGEREERGWAGKDVLPGLDGGYTDSCFVISDYIVYI
jgi:hypothetical protein